MFKPDLVQTSISAGGPTANYIGTGGSSALHRIWMTFDKQ